MKRGLLYSEPETLKRVWLWPLEFAVTLPTSVKLASVSVKDYNKLALVAPE
jgi:hypothetical protein